MKKLFLLLALLGIVATGCSKDEVDKGNDNKTEQPNEDEGGNIPDDAYISLDKEIVTISPDGESVGVKVYSNYAWELTNNCDWITTSITSGNASDTGVTVTLTADLTYDDRDGTILFSCGKAKKLLVVSQKFKEAIIPDANNTLDIPVEGGVAVITYQTTVDCDVIIPEEAQSWITIEPSTRGLVSESITLNIAENTTYSARTAVVKVVAKDNAEIFVKYTINQEQKNGVLVDGNNTFTVPGIGGSLLIKYQANVDCEVIIPDEAQDWVTIAPATRGLSTYSTTLNIAENNSGKERSCVIKVTSQDDNELFAEYTITQNPGYFLYYTSSNGNIVQPYRSSAFGATILSNTYKDGVGIIEFNAPITTIGDSAFYNRSSLTSVTIPDSVTTIGEMAFWYCSSLTSIYISDLSAWCKIDFGSPSANPLYYATNLYLNNELVTDLVIPSDITEIKSYAFYNCRSLTSITIGDSVTTIGEDAFYGCSSLTSVTIPDSVTTIGDYAFWECISLTSVTIPDSVTTIGDYAFEGCRSLTSVTIGDSVTSIGESTFSCCSNLTSVTIPESVTTIGNHAFIYCNSLTSVTIPDSVTTIGVKAFFSCDSLTSVTIGDSVTTIGDYAFELCSSLTSVIIPDSVTTFGDRAFYGCTGELIVNCNIPSASSSSYGAFYGSKFTTVTIGDSVTTIGNSAFSDCSSLTSVTIPDSVTTIGDEAFEYCSSLTSVTIPNSVTSIGNYAFRGCSSLTSVTIPDSVTTIGDDAFWYCSSLTSVYITDLSAWCKIDFGNDWTNPLYYGASLYLNNKLVTNLVIPSDIAEIKSYAFRGCSSLTSVTIPDSVTTIGDWAFCECSNLTSVTIGDSVTTIGELAFSGCSSLTSVYCKAVTPPTGGPWMFDYNASGRKIYVPMESVDAYRMAPGWGEYVLDIVGYDF